MPNVNLTQSFLSRRYGRSLALFAVLWVGLAFASQAQAEAKPETLDTASNPVLASLAKAGAKFYYMGRNGDINGWVSVNGNQVRVIYKPVNGTYVAVNSLSGAKGETLTLAQIRKLAADNNKELTSIVTAVDEGTRAKDKTPVPPVPAKEEAAPAASPDTAKADESLPLGERLMKELGKATTVSLGGNVSAPELYVVLSPGCIACGDFWKKFHDPVQKGLVRLRVIPVGPPGSDYENSGAALLGVPDPLTAFDKYTGGDTSALAGTANQAAVDQVENNTLIAIRWQLPTIPYILYRGKDGQVKVVAGAPQNPQVLLNDLAPPSADSVKP